MANWLVAPLLLRHFKHMSDTASKTMIIAPDPDAPGLSQPVTGVDESGAPVTLPVVTEKPLTLFLNRQEIVTSMTCLLYTSPSPRDRQKSRMPSSA